MVLFIPLFLLIVQPERIRFIASPSFAFIVLILLVYLVNSGWNIATKYPKIEPNILWENSQITTIASYVAVTNQNTGSLFNGTF